MGMDNNNDDPAGFPLSNIPGQPIEPEPSDPVTVGDEIHPLFPWLTLPRRAYFYRVAAAVGLLAGIMGWVGDEQIIGIIGVVAAFLGNGLAVAQTPTRAN